MILDNFRIASAVASLLVSASEYKLFKVLKRKCGLICAFKKESSAFALSASALAACCTVIRKRLETSIVKPTAIHTISIKREIISIGIERGCLDVAMPGGGGTGND